MSTTQRAIKAVSVKVDEIMDDVFGKGGIMDRAFGSSKSKTETIETSTCSVETTRTVQITMDPAQVQRLLQGETLEYKAPCAGLSFKIRQRKEGEEIE